MAVIVVGLLYLSALTAVLAYAAGGWVIGLALLGVLLYVLVRELPASRVVDDAEPDEKVAA